MADSAIQGMTYIDMKKTLKYIAVLIIYLSVLAGCSQQNMPEASAGTEGQLHLVFVTPLYENQVWQAARDGFDAASGNFNFRGDWVGPTAIDVDEMIKQIKIAIAEKADGIITQGTNPEAMVPVLEQANEAGIPVVVVNSDIPDAPRLAYVGTDTKKIGNLGAKAILEKTGDAPIKAAYMTAALDYRIGIDMVAGYEEILKTAPGGYEKLIIAEDRADFLNSIKQFENIFNTYPECSLVVSVTGSGGVAAQKVVQDKGLSGKVTIMAIDDVAQTLDGVRNGDIYGTMTQNFYRMGYQAAEWICDYVRNGKMPERLINDSGTLIVTKNNIDTYKEDMMDPESWN